jgi:hypothetical protein
VWRKGWRAYRITSQVSGFKAPEIDLRATGPRPAGARRPGRDSAGPSLSIESVELGSWLRPPICSATYPRFTESVPCSHCLCPCVLRIAGKRAGNQRSGVGHPHEPGGSAAIFREVAGCGPRVPTALAQLAATLWRCWPCTPDYRGGCVTPIVACARYFTCSLKGD